MKVFRWHMPLCIMTVGLVGFLGPALAHEGTSHFNFSGYWEGINSEDGAVTHLSISHMMETDVPEIPETPDNPEGPEIPIIPDIPENPDVPNIPDEPENPDVPEAPEGVLNQEGEVFTLLTASTNAPEFCEEEEGYSIGTARITEGRLISEDRTIICAGEVGGEVNSSPVELVPNKRDDVIMMKFLSSDRGPIVFHRQTSRNKFRGLWGFR